jgi:hypothetical protein
LHVEAAPFAAKDGYLNFMLYKEMVETHQREAIKEPIVIVDAAGERSIFNVRFSGMNCLDCHYGSLARASCMHYFLW